VLDLGIALRVATQVDALAQAVHRVQVVLPLPVQDLEDDAALEVGEVRVADRRVLRGQRGAPLRLLLQERPQAVEDGASQRVAVARGLAVDAEGRLAGPHRQAELRLERLGQGGALPPPGGPPAGPGYGGG